MISRMRRISRSSNRTRHAGQVADRPDGREEAEIVAEVDRVILVWVRRVQELGLKRDAGLSDGVEQSGARHRRLAVVEGGLAGREDLPVDSTPAAARIVGPPVPGRSRSRHPE